MTDQILPDNPQRVLLLCDFFSSLGGTEYYNAILAKGLKDLGIDVRVYIGEKPQLSHWVKFLDKHDIPHFEPNAHHEDLEADDIEKRFIAEHVDAINNWKPDVIHCHPFKKTAINWLVNPDSLKSIPIVATEWTTPNASSNHWFDDRLARHINDVGAYIATCKALEAGIRDYHGYKGKIAVIPHLLDIPPSQTKALADNTQAVGCISRLSAEKGLDFLIGAWKSVHEKVPQASLHIYGHGPDLQHLMTLRDSLGLRDVIHFEGTFEPYTGIDDVANKHDFFLQPSLFESIPTSIIELMLRGKALVATEVGGVPELIDKSTGILVKPANTTQLSDGILALLQDPVLTRQLGNNALVRSRKMYDYETNIGKIVSLYRTVMDESRASALSAPGTQRV